MSIISQFPLEQWKGYAIQTITCSQLLLLLLLFYFFFQFLHLDQSNPPENVKAQITKNETLSSVSETAQALLTRVLVSSAIYLIRHD